VSEPGFMARSMGKRAKTGVCHICGNKGQLSFEHVPPESAFNNSPMVRIVGRDLIQIHPDNLRFVKGSIDQRGQGAYTLCPRCNNKTEVGMDLRTPNGLTKA
jgi:hypothetical protein